MVNMKIRVVGLYMHCAFWAWAYEMVGCRIYNLRRLGYAKGCSDKSVLLPVPALKAKLASCLLSKIQLAPVPVVAGVQLYIPYSSVV